MANWVERARQSNHKQKKQQQSMNEENLLSRWGQGYDHAHKNEEGYTSLSKRWKDLYKRATDYYNNEAYKGYADAYNGMVGNEGYVGKKDAGRWYNDLEAQKNNANEGVDELLAELDKYSKYYNEDAVKYVRDLITQRQKSYDDVLTDAKKFNDYWSQWETEDDYNKAVWYDKYSKMSDEELAAAREDFNERAYAKNSEIPGYQALDAIDNAITVLGDVGVKAFNKTFGTNLENKPRSALGGYVPEEMRSEKEILDYIIDRRKYEADNADYLAVQGNEDFADKSKYVSTKTGDREVDWLATIGNALANAVLDTQQGAETVYKGGQGYEDIVYDIINGNPESKRYLDEQNMNAWGGLATGLGLTSTEYLTQLEDEEKGIFNYLYATEGKERAYEYLSHLEDKYLNARARKELETQMSSFASEAPVLSSLATVATAPVRGLAWFSQIADLADDGEIQKDARYNQLLYSTNAIRDQVSKDLEASGKWGEVGSFLYGVGMSMGDFLTSTVAGFGNPTATGLIMATSAAADTTMQGIDRGLDSTRAFITGAIAGVAEFITERMQVERLFDLALLGKDKFTYVLKNALSEGAEEGITDIVNWSADGIYDLISGQNMSEWKMAIAAYEEQGYSTAEAFGKALGDRAVQLGTDVAAGMLSGGIMGGAGAGLQTISEFREGGKYKSDPEALINEALKLNPNDEYALELKAKLESGENISRAALGKLSFSEMETVREAFEQNDKNIKAREAESEQKARDELKGKYEKKISSRVEDKGARSSLAESITKAVRGEKVSNAELRRISQNEAALRVLKKELGADFDIKAGVTVSDLRKALTPKQSSSTRLSSENILSTYSAFYNMDEAAERSLMVNYAADVKSAENGKAVNPEDYAAVYGLVYAAGKKGADVATIAKDASGILSQSAIVQAYRAGQNAVKDAEGGSPPAGAPAVRSGEAQEFKGSITSRTYSAEAAQLLSTAQIGEIDSNKSYYTLDSLGIPNAEQKAWIDAGLAQERNVRGETVATVNTTVLQQEMRRRGNPSTNAAPLVVKGISKPEVNEASPKEENTNQAQKENTVADERVVYSSKSAKAYDPISNDKLDSKQKKVVDVAAQIGRKVIFATTVNEDGVEVDGFIAKNGDIYINPNKNVAPMAFVFKHELTHFAERAGQKYQDFKNLVRKSEAFKGWLKEKGLTEQQYNARLREERASIGQKLDESGATVEIISNFVGDMLFGDNNTISEDLIRELKPDQRKTVRDYVRDFFSWIKSKFVGEAGRAKVEIRKLEKAFGAAYRVAVESSNVNTSEEQFSFNDLLGQQLKDWIKGGGKKYGSYNGEYFELGTTPDILIKHGAQKVPVIMSADCVAKVTGMKNDLGHNISIDEIARLPLQLNDPILLFKGNYANSFVALTELVDKQGHDVVVAIHINRFEKRTKITKIASLYSKTDDYGNNNIVRYVQNQINQGNLIDASTTKAPNWFTIRGLQLPKMVQTILDANNSIAQKSKKSTQNSKKVLEDGGEQFSYTPQNEKIEDIFERIRSGELSLNDAEKLLKKPEGDNPATIANLKKEDMGSTPNVNKKTNGNAGDGDSRFAGSIQRSSIFNEEFKKEVSENSFVKHYAAITNKETLAEAAKRLDQGGEAYVTEWLSKKTVHMDTVDTVVGFILLKRYQDVGNYEGATAVAQKVRDVGTLSGQRVQAFSIIGRFDADMMQAYAQKELDKAWELAIEGRSDKWIEKHREQFKLTDEDVSFIRDNIMYAAKMPENSRERAIALAQITTLIQSKIPPTRAQSFKAWQRVSMLLNPRTQLRNVFGNAMMAPVFVVSDWFSTPADYFLSKKTGVRTTGLTGLHGKTEGVKAMGKGFAESYDDWKRHINTKAAEQNRFEIGQGKSFDETKWGRIAKIMNSFDRFNSFLLDAGDRPFYEMWFINSLNEQMRLNNMTEPTEAMVQIAVDEALARTWQDENRMTKLVSGIKKAANQISIAGYGMGDVLIKFTKTPANLTKAIYDFSPAAIATIAPQAVRLTKAIKNGTATPSMQKKFVSNFGKMAAGTMLYVIFAALYAAGHIKGSSDEDKDVAAFEKYIQGIPEYSIKIGDKWYSYDWAQPIGAVPAIISDYMESRKEGGGAIDSVINAFKAGGEVLFNQSFMTSFRTLFSAESFSEGLFDIILGEISVPVPTIFSQLANVLDDKRRATYDSTSEFKSALNRAMLKIPGVRNMLEAEIDVLGREVDNSQKSWFNAFFNPANVYTDTSTDVTDHAYEIYKSTGDVGAIPTKAPYSVKLQGKTVKLDDSQRAQYQKAMGETASDLIEILLKNDVYKAMNDEEKLSVLKQVYSYSSSVAKDQLDWADDYEVISGIAPYITKKDFEAMTDEERYKIVSDYIFSDYEGMEDIKSDIGQSNFIINKKTANLVLSATLVGDIDKAVELIDGIESRVESYGWDKEDTAAEIKDRKTSVKTAVTRYWKEAYLYAYYKNDNEQQDKIFDMLVKLGIYGDETEVEQRLSEWVEIYEEENE